MSRLPAPISDYATDTKSVLDQSLRILQAITDVSADAGWLDTALVTMMLVQSLMQVLRFAVLSMLCVKCCAAHAVLHVLHCEHAVLCMLCRREVPDFQAVVPG